MCTWVDYCSCHDHRAETDFYVRRDDGIGMNRYAKLDVRYQRSDFLGDRLPRSVIADGNDSEEYSFGDFGKILVGAQVWVRQPTRILTDDPGDTVASFPLDDVGDYLGVPASTQYEQLLCHDTNGSRRTALLQMPPCNPRVCPVKRLT